MASIDDLPDNIKSKLRIVDNKHWIWTGGITSFNRPDPKGRLRYNGKMEYPHRVILSLLGKFNLYSDLQVNHRITCQYSLCCNPDCLYAGTQKENVDDMIFMGKHKELRKTRCKNCGGTYSISPTNGHRYCQTCKNRRRAKWRKRQ